MIAGSYRLEEEIGRGGMAVVHRAFDTRHDREVAVKTLLPDVTAAVGGPERFLREIRLAAQLNHPHIVPLYDSGAAEGLLYYVMPLIAGRTLRDHMSRTGRLQPAEALKIGRQVASALDYAHRRGVVHRDIKPENILLHEGEAMVTDFGIAMALSNLSGARLTQTGLALGTPAYMSPEQGAGEAEVDGRSDQYSLACVVYEMLTGEPPFVAASPQALIARRFTQKPQSVRVIIPAISGSVARAVDRALSLEVGERFTTAADFGAALAQPAQREETEKPTIAVLPFVNMSTDAEQEFFSDGVTEEIINSLSKVQGLQVVSRRSAFAWKGKDIDTRSIGAQLGASSLVEGTVRRSGSKLRVSAELIDVETGLQQWSAKYDREMTEIFAIQDEIASSIVKALSVVLSERERITMKAPRTTSVRAYEYYLRGRQLFSSFRRSAFKLAEDQFRHAISFDPDYAQAYAGLADVAAYRHIYFSAEREAVEQADTASRKAVELDPGLAEAHASRGLAFFSREKYDEAEQEFRQAMELDPTLFEAPYYYARLFHLRGQSENAVRYYAIAARLRPDDYQANCLAAGLYLAMGRTAEGLEASRQGVAAAERVIAADPSDVRALYLGAGVLYNLGRLEEAGQWARRAVEIDPEDPGMMYNVACFFAIAEMKDDAIGMLERAADLGWNRTDWARNDVDFTSIRNEERFTRLLARMDASLEATKSQ